MPFVTKINNRKYVLSPVIQLALNGTEMVVGADIYGLDGTYKGYWPASNMMGSILDQVKDYATMSKAGRVPHLRVIRRPEDVT